MALQGTAAAATMLVFRQIASLCPCTRHPRPSQHPGPCWPMLAAFVTILKVKAHQEVAKSWASCWWAALHLREATKVQPHWSSTTCRARSGSSYAKRAVRPACGPSWSRDRADLTLGWPSGCCSRETPACHSTASVTPCMTSHDFRLPRSGLHAMFGAIGGSLVRDPQLLGGRCIWRHKLRHWGGRSPAGCHTSPTPPSDCREPPQGISGVSEGEQAFVPGREWRWPGRRRTMHATQLACLLCACGTTLRNHLDQVSGQAEV